MNVACLNYFFYISLAVWKLNVDNYLNLNPQSKMMTGVVDSSRYLHNEKNEGYYSFPIYLNLNVSPAWMISFQLFYVKNDQTLV